MQCCVLWDIIPPKLRQLCSFYIGILFLQLDYNIKASLVKIIETIYNLIFFELNTRCLFFAGLKGFFREESGQSESLATPRLQLSTLQVCTYCVFCFVVTNCVICSILLSTNVAQVFLKFMCFKTHFKLIFERQCTTLSSI